MYQKFSKFIIKLLGGIMVSIDVFESFFFKKQVLSSILNKKKIFLLIILQICVLKTYSDDVSTNFRKLSEKKALQVKPYVIVFDYGDVLAKNEKEEYRKFIKISFNLSDEELKNILLLKNNYLLTNESEKKFWQKFALHNGWNIQDIWYNMLEKVKISCLKINEKVLDIVKKLKQNNYKVVIFANTVKDKAYIREQSGHFSYFEEVFLSCRIGLQKPDPKAFFFLMDRLKKKPEFIVFVDDKIRNVIAAKRLGIKSILFRNAVELKKKIKEYKIDLS